MPETTQPDADQLMREYVDLLNGDDSKLDVLSESYTYHGPGLPEEGIQGRATYWNFLQTFHNAFSDLEYAMTGMLAADGVAMTEWTVTGTHDGEFNEIPPTGRTIEIDTMGKQVIEDGTIAEEWGFYDTSDLLAQLGVTDE